MVIFVDIKFGEGLSPIFTVVEVLDNQIRLVLEVVVCGGEMVT